MTSFRRGTCRDCGVSGNDAPISKAGYCPDCGDLRLLRHNAALRDGHGPQHDSWLAAWTSAAVRMSARHADVDAALDGGGTSDRSAAPPQQ